MLLTTIKAGFINGLKCFWILIKIIVPVYFVITTIKHTPIMGWLMALFNPIMKIFNMSGEAAVPIVTGALLDEYSAIAAIKAVELTGYSVTVISIMILIAHSLVVEAAILKKMELSVVFFTSYRIIAACAMGIAFSWIGGALL